MEPSTKSKRPKSKKVAIYYTLKSRLDAAYEEIKQLREENRRLEERLRHALVHQQSKELFPPTHGW